jgi:tRNA pseudouridine38-40 synthase
MPRTFKLTLQYDGTDYVGWQRQAEGVSIQGLLEDALKPIEGSAVTVHGAGRTDAGVHALGQVASVRLTATLDTTTLARALNAVLPLDLRVARVEEVSDDFHARFSATGKVYQYRIVNGPFAPPFIRRYVLHVIPKINLDAVRDASVVLVGTHDFAAFQGTGTAVPSTVRCVQRIDWTEHPDGLIVMEVEGDGFLRHMVRNMAGTLVEIGLGRWPASAMRDILESRDRARAGTTAPPQGLFLIEVKYAA